MSGSVSAQTRHPFDAFKVHSMSIERQLVSAFGVFLFSVPSGTPLVCPTPSTFERLCTTFVPQLHPNKKYSLWNRAEASRKRRGTIQDFLWHRNKEADCGDAKCEQNGAKTRIKCLKSNGTLKWGLPRRADDTF